VSVVKEQKRLPSVQRTVTTTGFGTARHSEMRNRKKVEEMIKLLPEEPPKPKRKFYPKPTLPPKIPVLELPKADTKNIKIQTDDPPCGLSALAPQPLLMPLDYKYISFPTFASPVREPIPDLPCDEPKPSKQDWAATPLVRSLRSQIANEPVDPSLDLK
jgi:hypothetical protein